MEYAGEQRLFRFANKLHGWTHRAFLPRSGAAALSRAKQGLLVGNVTVIGAQWGDEGKEKANAVRNGAATTNSQ